MTDGNLLQTSQRRFDFEGRIAVKLTVTVLACTVRGLKKSNKLWSHIFVVILVRICSLKNVFFVI